MTESELNEAEKLLNWTDPRSGPGGYLDVHIPAYDDIHKKQKEAALALLAEVKRLQEVVEAQNDTISRLESDLSKSGYNQADWY